MGKVVLVGAGPGDEGLLTLKGEKYIKEADCLVYDRLSSPKLLELAKDTCELIYVGKENHKHVMKQESINELLFQKSNEYPLVVRLKGGDPYVFGRGGEEALYLTDKNVRVEVVPGVSSSVAALADAGIPITHRGIAKGFNVITAHSRKDEEADIDYSQLTDSTITCVFLMGLAHVKSIAKGLMDAGRDKNTPAAVISNATLPCQRKCIGKLCDIGHKIEQADLRSPAVIVVGDVVSLCDKLDFFEKRPMFGKKIIVPYIQSVDKYMDMPYSRGKQSPLIEKLSELGADVTAVITGKIKPIIITDFQDKIKASDWILFTSKNGVKTFFYNLNKSKADIRILCGCQFGVVGSATAAELRKYHINADLISEVNTGKGLAECFLKKTELALKKERKQNVLIWSAQETSGELEKALEGFVNLKKIDAYVNEEYISENVRFLDDADAVVYTSASNVNRFLKENHYQKKKIKAFSIGPKTTAALHDNGISDVVEAYECSYDSLIQSLKEL